MIDGATVSKSISEIGTTVLLILLGTVLIEAILYLTLVRWLKWKFALPFMLLTPAMLGLLALVVYPLLWEFNLSFTNMSLRHFLNYSYQSPNILSNYLQVFTAPVLKQVFFGPLLIQTILWTAINLVFHVTGGMILALLMNRPMKLRGIYRMIIIIPWALPNIIAVLAWRGEFNFEYGYINVILTHLGLSAINWLQDPTANFVAMCITNIWLGIPFMSVILLGGLQSIAGEYYEAAEMDGATAWQSFWKITWPLMQPVMAPAIILGTIWTFNNFNVPFFINQNELESSDILVTALFRSAFQYNRYGFAAAFAFVNFVILLIYAIFYLRTTGQIAGAKK
jgi:arabinogalactan oligomer / maltooligosaccharide transport system permease protein